MKKLKKNKSNDYKYLQLFLSIWLVFFVVLGIAFSGFTTTLKAEGTALIQAHIYDYVYITKATVSDSSGGSSINYSFLDHEIKANISTPSCNNYVTYKLEIVNTTDARAYITKANLASAVNGNGNTSTSFSVEFIDGDTNSAVIPNTTYLKPHSSKVIYVKMKNNCSGSDTSGTITANFEYSLYRYYDLTIKCSDPANANITMTTSEGTYTGTGSLTQQVVETDVVSYSVSKNEYYTKTDSFVMVNQNHTIDVTLEEIIKRYILNFDANGGSVGQTSKTVIKGEKLGTLPTPTRPGFIFIGWFDEKTATRDSSKNYIKHPLYYYADTYGDLYNAFAYDENQLYNHYLNHGINEGRRISQFTSDDTCNFTSDKTVYAGWVPDLSTVTETKQVIIDYGKTYNNCSTMAGTASNAVNKCYTNPFDDNKKFVFALPYLSTVGVTGNGQLSSTAMNSLYPNATAHPYKCDHTMYITTTSSNSGNELRFKIDDTVVHEVIGKTIPVKDDGYGTPFTQTITSAALTSSTRSSNYKYDFRTPRSLGMSSSAVGIYSLNIKNYFYKSNFLAGTGKSGITVSVSPSQAYTGDTVKYTASGNFRGWYSDIDCTNLVSSSATYNITAGNTAQILYAC